MRRLFMMVAVSIQLLLDLVLPRKERTVRTENYTLEDVEVSPAEHEACGIAITSLLSYRESAVEDLIRAVKYDGSHHAAGLLAGILAEYLREEVASIRSFSVRPVVLVPLPLHPNRQLERGFNQIEFIMDKLPAEFHDGSLAQIGRDVLLRVRETTQQTHLNRVERLRNVKGAFAVSNMTAVIGAHAFVIDDVTTTGATLAEATRPLASLGIPVNALALARA
jgi:ComF family protein